MRAISPQTPIRAVVTAQIFELDILAKYQELNCIAEVKDASSSSAD